MTKFYLSLSGVVLLLLSPNFIQAQEADIDLKIKEVNSGIMIEWGLSSGITAKQIMLERSVRSKPFAELETYDETDIQVFQEDETYFSFLDSQMGMEKVAYRLRVIEEDQSTFFSKPTEIVKKTINTYRVAKQELLSQGVFKVTIEAIEKSDLEFFLIDESGEKIFKEKWSADLGLNDFFINLDYFNDGSYSALIKKGKEYQTLNINKTTRKTDEVAMKDSKWKAKQ